MADALQKAQERLALHELIRVGVGRQEDLRLLQNVAMQASCLPAASVAQLLREAALREEWRATREASLLGSLQAQPLCILLGPGRSGCLSAADGRLLEEQVAVLTQMLEQQQQRRRQRAALPKSGRSGSNTTASAGTGTGRAGVPGASWGPSPSNAPSTPGQLRPYLTPLGPPHYQTPQPARQQQQAAAWAPGEDRGGGRTRPATSYSSPPTMMSTATATRTAATTAAATGAALLRSASAGAAATASSSSPSFPSSFALVGGGGRERCQPRQRLPGDIATGTTTAAAAALYGGAAAGALALPPRSLCRGSGGGGSGVSGRGHGAGAGRRSNGAAAAAAYSSPSPHRTPTADHGPLHDRPRPRPRPRPGSAPLGAHLGDGDWRAGTVAAAAAAAVNDRADRAAVAGGGGRADGSQRCSGFRNLLRLQQLLMQGLREHAQEEGEGGALEALAASVAEGQAFFADCLADALEAAGLQPDVIGVSGAAGQSVRRQYGSGSPGRRVPVVAWDRLLRLGQLGLTRSDVARLEQIRRQQAARTIQRQVRKWLRRRRHERRIAEARARAEAMQRRLRERAAIVIQAWMRGHLARRLAARLAAQAARQRAAQRLAAAARALAATRIQRAWRAHRRALRYAAALARAEEQRRRQQQQQLVQEQHQQQRQGPQAQGPQEQRPHQQGRAGGDAAGADEQRLQGQEAQQRQRAGAGAGADAGPGGAGSSRPSREQAVVVIQAHLRGWLVRRSSALWWARASHSLRERRAAVRAWQQHQRFMQASYDVQAQLLGAMVREAQVAAALQADRRRQEAEMAAAFNEWLLQQQRVALSQPLPRGWVPHPHPEDPARTCFLNTRTGELHSLHPAVAELARHAQEQHAAASVTLQQRFAGVPAYVAQLHDATSQQAAIAMRAIAVMYQRALAGGGTGVGAGKGGTGGAAAGGRDGGGSGGLQVGGARSGGKKAQ